METAPYILIILAVILIIFQVSRVDFKDLSWKRNGGTYMGIIAMLLVIASMIITIQN